MREILLGGLGRPDNNVHARRRIHHASPTSSRWRGQCSPISPPNSVRTYLPKPALPANIKGTHAMHSMTRRRSLRAPRAASSACRRLFCAESPQRGGTLRISVDQARRRAQSAADPRQSGIPGRRAALHRPDPARAGHVRRARPRPVLVAKPRPDGVDLQAAPGRHVPRRLALHRRGCRRRPSRRSSTRRRPRPARTNVGPIDGGRRRRPRPSCSRSPRAYADLPVALAYTNAKIMPAAIVAGDLDRLSRERDRHRAVQARRLRARPPDRGGAQRRLLRPAAPLSRSRRGAGLSRPHRRGLGADLAATPTCMSTTTPREYRSGSPAPAGVEGAARALRPVPQRQHAVATRSRSATCACARRWR